MILFVLVALAVALVLSMGLLDRWTQSKTSYQKWLEGKLEDDPFYIDWLEHANNGRDYKLGLKILKRLERGRKKEYRKLIQENERRRKILRKEIKNGS